MMIAMIRLASRMPSRPLRDLAGRRSVRHQSRALASVKLPSAGPDVAATAPSRPCLVVWGQKPYSQAVGRIWVVSPACAEMTKAERRK